MAKKTRNIAKGNIIKKSKTKLAKSEKYVRSAATTKKKTPLKLKKALKGKKEKRVKLTLEIMQKRVIPTKGKARIAKKPPIVSPILGPLGIEPYKPKKGEAYMSEKQLQHFEKILNMWKNQLMAEVDRTIYDLQDVANYPDPIDRASQEEVFNLQLRERDRERKLLKKIDETLLRIKDGGYGFCDECGAEIGIQRLEARPTATQCVYCKTITEIREKQISM